MASLDYEYFFKQLQAGVNIDETEFEIIGDSKYDDCYIGYQPQFENPYWAGLCDIKDGCDFKTADDLVNAKIYHGKSIKELWDSIEIISIEGTCVEEWLKYFKHAE